MWKPAVIDAATGEVRIPHGSIGDRFGEEGVGRWNLELGDIDPALSMYRDHQGGTREAVEVELPRFDAADGKVVHERRGVPVARVGRPRRHHRARPAARPVRRRARRPARHLAAHERVRPARLRRPGRAGDPRVAGAAHRRARRPGRPARAGVGAERDRHRGPRHDPARRRRQPLVPLRPDLPRDPAAHHDHRHAGPQRRRLGALRRAGEDPPDHGLPAHGLRARLAPPAAPHEPDRLLVREHLPVPLRHLHRRRPRRRHRGLRREDGDGPAGPVGPARVVAVVPDLRPQQPAAGRRRRGGRRWRRRRTSPRS